MVNRINGHLVRQRLGELGLELAHVAILLGVKPETLSHYIRGHRSVPEGRLKVLAEVLKVIPEDLKL